jgi:antitoxin ParD1/3/4
MDTIPISLPEALAIYVKTKINAGQYTTPSDYIQALIRQDQDQDQDQRDYLEPLVLEGLNSGPSTPMTQSDWDDIRATVQERQKLRRNNA